MNNLHQIDKNRQAKKFKGYNFNAFAGLNFEDYEKALQRITELMQTYRTSTVTTSQNIDSITFSVNTRDGLF